MAIGALQKCRVGVPQQVGGHLFAGSIFQQIGGEKVAHRMQVVIFRETVAVVQFPQVAAEGVRVEGLPLVRENQVIRADAVVFRDLRKQ